MSFVKRSTLISCAEILRGKERTVEILRGEFKNFHEPSDLLEKQGRYGEVFLKGSKLRRGRTVDLSHKDRRIYP
jgi:hypothetical protein